ncbi:MAG: S1 RNA-binding domain-containing protein [Planctomycetota bacterium]|nr:MAG: S1 RNA-binding domain-containing protein [Planctomycetota bacterium]
MTTNPDPSSTDQTEPVDATAQSESVSPSRRIQIGTQRAGVTPPSLAPKYQYIAPPAPRADDAGATAAAGATAEPQTASAGDAPASGEPRPEGRGPRDGGRGRRDRRRDDKPRSFADALPPARRVAVPNIRGGLDEDLEADFEAALEGVAIDALLDAGASAKAEAPIDPGSRLMATVLSIGPDTAFVDLGGRRQGAMKLAGLLDAGIDLPAVGDSIEVSVGSRNDDDNLYDVALANRAVSVEDWSQIQAGMIVEARVTAANKGGLECEVAGLRGFMPASLVSTWRIENLEEMVGQTLDSLVTEIVPEARRLVLSRRAVIEKQAADAKAKMLETLEPGVEFDGIVRSVREFGAFVDIGNGVEGLIHVSELSWDRVANAADVLKAGEKVRVVVKKVDRETGKIGLSARDLIESPWKRAGDKYHVGATVKGVVSRIAQFGAFVKLEPGVEGLVHISELATRRIRSVSDVAREGQQVECRVITIDPDEQRLSLSIKALAPSPASKEQPAAEEPEADEPEAPPPVVKKRNTPLKGGTGGNQSQGEKFGLRW